jgi:CDP-diacylglycerol--serine O-phosphatidyltransferase
VIFLWCSFLLVLPAAFGGLIHMYAVKKDWASVLKIPLNLWAFGSNKTLRGFIIMPLATLLGTFISMVFEQQLASHNQFGLSRHWVYYGIGLGFCYTLFELPNSFIKRRMSIVPGKKSDQYKWLFWALDYTDSTIGIGLFYWLVIGTRSDLILTGMILSIFIHLIINLVLYKLGIRKEML